MTYPMTIAGIKRELPLCKVADDFYIGAFIMFGDAEITVACAKELLARAPKEYDYLLTAEAKSIPLIHEMARQSGASEYFVARKGMKVYLTDPIHVQVRSITTQHDQDLYLSGEEAAKMKEYVIATNQVGSISLYAGRPYILTYISKGLKSLGFRSFVGGFCVAGAFWSSIRQKIFSSFWISFRKARASFSVIQPHKI